ncbi:FtsK/SpoIIIE family DNA translocase [Candidatus Ruminimicrobiellum ovillum]|uniref:FtsK/SpoIIIE family DNA translocase n=1 Tax=Candidatus Ruminimicrobiellum ovillum TaxID=1947927 RepID=UPI003559FBF1
MAKQTKKQLEEYKKSKRLLLGCICCAISFFLLYALISASDTGIVGEALSSIMFSSFGASSYIIPIILFWFGILYFITSTILRTRIDLVLAVVSVTLSSILFSLIKSIFNLKFQDGGWLGNTLSPFFLKFFGNWGSIAIVGICFIFFIAAFFRISLFKLAKYIVKSTIEDIKQWYEYRKAKKQEKPNIVQNRSKKEQEEETPFEQTEKPRIIDSRQNKKDDKEDFVQEQMKAARTEEQKKIQVQQPQEEKEIEQEPKQEPIAEPKPIVKQEKIDTKTFSYTLPPVTLLREGSLNTQINESELQERAEALREALKSFRIDAVVQDIIPGPVITRYDIVLAPGTKMQSVMNIMDDISLAMKTAAIRIEPVPEKSAVGIEIPNPKPSMVSLRDIIDTKEFKDSKSLLTLAVGTKTDGSGYISNLAKMPHLLIAGATGSGKSVGVHNIILSILYKARPDEVKFMLIDPKRVEMTAYKQIPHLYNPCCIADDADVITRPNEASDALKKLVKVMEERYEKYASNMVRNIEDYNAKMVAEGGDKDYYIIVIIDELADLMMVASKEIEDSIQRLAQMARAVGIHLILATQRPTVNVITGTIKANFPARQSFQTVSAVDSKVILDTIGAESLIGKGDMLFLPPSEPRPVRLQGAFVSSKEIEQVVKFIADQDFPKFYEPPTHEVSQAAAATAADKAEKDLIPALKLILERRRISQDLLKAQFGGSARATNILSVLEVRGFIHKPEGTNRWEINYNLVEDYLRINDN